MEFTTQRELLEYLGKNPDDRNLIQRMIARGEVHKEDGMYIYLPKVSIKDLYSEINQLKEKIKLLEDNAHTFSQAGDYNEAKVQWEYWEKECRRYGKLINGVIDVCYGKVKALLGSRFQEDKESFKEGVIEAVKEREKSE